VALRVKTVEYAFPTDTTALATATRRDQAAITLYIPETTSRTFRSVVVRVGYRDTNTTATTLTNPLIGVKLGAAAFSDSTLGNPAGNSGENQHYIFEREVTSYFTTNFGAAASQTFQVGTQQTGPSVTNITIKVIITYEFDDAAQDTRVKTVRIPIESTTGALTATLANVGTTQVPALDTFLPEASKVYRSIWLEAIYNEYTAGTANDAALGISIGGAAEQLTAVHESALASSCSGWVCFNQGAAPSWSTASAHNLQARSTTITTASTFNHVAFVLHVTYEYSHTSSTRILNSLLLGLGTIDLAGATTATDAAVIEKVLYVEEPGTITLVQSGALVQYAQTAAVGPQVSFGGQTARGYTDTALLYCGETFLCQRVDSGGAQGAGIALVRGPNKWRWAVHIGTAGFSPSSFDGYLILNYTSDKSAQGDGAHNHSTHWHLQGSQANGQISTITAAQFFNIPETKWWRTGLAFYSNGYGTVASPQYWFIGAENLSGEGERLDFRELGKGWFTHDGENGWYPISFTAQDDAAGVFQRFDADPDASRLALEGSRRWKIACGQSNTRPLMAWLTYHAITFSWSGTISESAGGTVNIACYRKSDGLKLGSTSRTGNGAYTITVYDNTETIFSEARESGTLLGRSDDGTATGSP
jgi:hypothetical protein